MASLEEVLARWGDSGSLRKGGSTGLQCAFAGETIEIAALEAAVGLAELRASWPAPAWLVSPDSTLLPTIASLATAQAFQGSALLSATPHATGIDISMPLYLEGLSRQEFVGAVVEVARAAASFAQIARDLDAQRPELLEAERSMAEAQRALEQADTAVRDAQAQIDGRAATESGTAAQASNTPAVAAPIPPGPAVDAPREPVPSSQPGAGICSNCGSSNAEGVRFCTRCGQPLAAPAATAIDGAATAPEGPPEAPPPAAATRCRTCGAELAAGARFCVTCGTPVT